MISIVIPTYNRAKILSKTLDSILFQSSHNWECIIVDDGSLDNTQEIVEQYSACDSRFVYKKNIRSKGAQGARNTGILSANGDWICLFDSDDIMYKDYIRNMQNKIMHNSADIVVCYANIRNLETKKIVGCLDKIQGGYIHGALLKNNIYIANDVCVIKKKKILEMGLLDEKCIAYQEWDTHISLSKNCKYEVVEVPLCEWTICGDSSFANQQKKGLDAELYIFTKHRSDFRRYAYRHYLNALYNLWSKMSNPWSLLCLAPELLLYKPLKMFLRK